MGTAPPGYKNEVVNGKKAIVIDPIQGPIMRWVFDEIGRGVLSINSVMESAKEKGLRGRGGKPIDKNSFWSAIRNPVYIGKIRIEAFKGEEETLVAGQHAPLIRDELFYSVQDVLHGKRKQMRVKIKVDDKFPLRGFLVCPSCNKVLTGSSSKGRIGYHHYYHCYKGCSVRFRSKMVNEASEEELKMWKPVEGATVLYNYIVRQMLRNKDEDRNKQVKGLRDELAGIEENKTKLRKMRIGGELDLEDYNIEKRDLEGKAASVQSKLESLISGDAINKELEQACTLFQQLDQLWANSSIEWQRSFIGSMFPEKLTFFGSGFRTSRINSAAQLIFSMDAAFSGKKIGQASLFFACPIKLSY